jgi:hypothetical protein
MIKKVILCFLLFFQISFTYSQTTDWVKSFGGPNSDKGISIGADTLGSVYISGFFNNQANFDASYVACSPISSSSNNKEFFLSKLDSLGNVDWAIRGGNGSGGCCDDRALGMHVTPDGYSFLTGTTWSSFDIGGCSLPSGAGNSHDGSILAKIDPNGNCVWLKTFGADQGAGSGTNCPWPIYDADDHAYDVKVDDDGNIYVVGFYSGLSADFDAFTITNSTWGADCQPKGYVGKLDANGDWLWVKNYDGIKDQRGSRDSRIAIDHFSNIYVTGGFQNTGNYGPLSLTSNGEWDAFIFKMDKDGNYLWARNVGSNKTDRGNGIAIDDQDNIYISGEYRNPMIFSGANASNGTDTLSHAKKRDVFVAKITTNGDWVWAKRARSKGTDKPYQMSVDKNMQVFISGMCGDSMKFTNSMVVSNGDTTANAFVAQLDGSKEGDWVWAKLGGGPTDDDRMGDICEDGGSNVYAVGFFEETANFDGYTFNSVGTDNKKDIIVWKLRKDQTVDITPANRIYVEVQPPGSGTVNMTGTGTIISDSKNVSNFPCYQSLSDSAIQNFEAVANTGYQFVDWDWKIHNPLPNNTSALTTVLTYTNDTLIVNFEIPPTDTITYIVQPPGSGTITVDGTNIIAFPNTSIYLENSNSTLTATPNAGYTFNNWGLNNNTAMPNATNPNITITWISDDTCFVNFDVIPLDSITYIVQPPGSGTITVDATNITTFPNTSIYVETSNSTLTANPSAGYSFGNWDFNNNTALPNSTSSNITVTWMSDDTCIVNFALIPTYDITYMTNPIGAGTIDVNAVNVNTFPTTINYLTGTNVDLVANSNPSFSFSHWTTQINTLNPNANTDMVDFNVVGLDTIVANYHEVDTLWVITNPPGVATLEVENDIITTSSFMGLYQKGTMLNIKATPNGSNVFNQWNLNNNALPDYNAITQFNFIKDDTLFAYFNNVLAIDDLGDDISNVKIYPNIVEDKVTIEILSTDNIQVQIDLLNLNGQKVQELFQGKIESNKMLKETFEIKGAHGIYFIRLQSDKSEATFKIVKI